MSREGNGHRYHEDALAASGAHALAHALSIVSSLLVGVALLVAPWWSFVWEANWLLPPSSLVRSVVLSPFTRGAVSGLGIVNILLAIHDARARLAPAAHPRSSHPHSSQQP